MERSTASPDTERVLNIFCEMRDYLSQQDGEALKSASKKLQSECKPQFTMDTLAPFLFRESDPGAKLSSQEALSVLGYLVASDSSSYLKPASVAVKNEAERLTTSDQPMIVSPELMTVLVDQLNREDVTASANASETIVMCCRKLGLSFGEPALRAVTDAWKLALGRMGSDRTTASTVAVRCASTIVMMMSLDDTMMQSALSVGANQLLLTMLTDDSDPLLQISILDLIEKLATTQPMHHERANWLFSDQIMQPLLRMAGGEEEGDPDPILGGPALRVVAALCKLGHRDSSLFGIAGTHLLNGFHRALHSWESSGELDRLALIDAISSFASASSDALDLVLNDPVTRETWLSLSVAQPKLKSVILTSVAMVLDPSPEVDANGDSITTSSVPTNDMGMKLYASLGRSNNLQTTELVLSLAKSPLPETRLGAYSLLKAVAKLPTGGQVLFSHNDFHDFLINRDREKTKEGREAKYALVKAIYESEVKGLLADDIVKQLENYLKEGPHYVQTLSWELATD